MPISTGRKMTDADIEKLERRAEAFCRRHNAPAWLLDDGESRGWIETVEDFCSMHQRENEGYPDANRLTRLWERIHERATGYPHHGYGYLGTNVD